MTKHLSSLLSFRCLLRLVCMVGLSPIYAGFEMGGSIGGAHLSGTNTFQAQDLVDKSVQYVLPEKPLSTTSLGLGAFFGYVHPFSSWTLGTELSALCAPGQKHTQTHTINDYKQQATLTQTWEIGLCAKPGFFLQNNRLHLYLPIGVTMSSWRFAWQEEGGPENKMSSSLFGVCVGAGAAWFIKPRVWSVGLDVRSSFYGEKTLEMKDKDSFMRAKLKPRILNAAIRVSYCF